MNKISIDEFLTLLKHVDNLEGPNYDDNARKYVLNAFSNMDDEDKCEIFKKLLEMNTITVCDKIQNDKKIAEDENTTIIIKDDKPKNKEETELNGIEAVNALEMIKLKNFLVRSVIWALLIIVILVIALELYSDFSNPNGSMFLSVIKTIFGSK